MTRPNEARQLSDKQAEGHRENEKQANTARTWTAESCAQALDQFIEAHGRHPHPSECNSQHQLPSRRTVERLLGMSPLEYYCHEAPERGYDLSIVRRGATRSLPPKKSYTAESIYESLKEFVQREGRVPVTHELGKNGLPYGYTIRRVTGITARKLMQQWFPEHSIPKTSHTRWTAEGINEAMDRFVEQHGRPPMTSELNRTHNLPTPSSIESKFGMPAIEFMRKRYPEHFPDAGLEQDDGSAMTMM